MPLYLLLPLGAAILYTLSSLYFKRAYQEGAGSLETFHWSNVISAPLTAPIFFLNPAPFPLTDLWQPALTSAIIFLAAWSTFAAIKHGDVSMVTPILGCKVVFVALCTALFTAVHLPLPLWIAALFTTAGVFITGYPEMKSGKGSSIAILQCLSAAAFFGLSDVLLHHWANGNTIFLGLIPCFVALYSLLLIPLTAPDTWRRHSSRPWVLRGTILLCLQGAAMGVALTFFDPTRVNICYSTRGLWSLIIVWLFGARFGNTERHSAGPRTMLWRLAGTVSILAGVVLAVTH